MFPDIDEWESILFATFLFGPDTCSGLASSFKSAIEKGGWKVPRKTKLGQVGHVHKILRGMEEKGVIVQLDQKTIKKELKKTNKSKKGNIGKYYVVNPKFLIDLVHSYGPIPVGTSITEEDAKVWHSSIVKEREENTKAFLSALQKFSPGRVEVIRILGQFTDHQFDPTILGYLWCITEELSLFLDLNRNVLGIKESIVTEFHKVQRYRLEKQRRGKRSAKETSPSLESPMIEPWPGFYDECGGRIYGSSIEQPVFPEPQWGAFRSQLAILAGDIERLRSIISSARYFNLRTDLKINASSPVAQSCHRFCRSYQYFHNWTLHLMRLRKKGLELPTSTLPVDG